MEDDSESLIRIDSVELTSDCLFQKILDDESLQQGRLLKQTIVIFKTKLSSSSLNSDPWGVPLVGALSQSSVGLDETLNE